MDEAEKRERKMSNWMEDAEGEDTPAEEKKKNMKKVS